MATAETIHINELMWDRKARKFAKPDRYMNKAFVEHKGKKKPYYYFFVDYIYENNEDPENLSNPVGEMIIYDEELDEVDFYRMIYFCRRAEKEGRTVLDVMTNSIIPNIFKKPREKLEENEHPTFITNGHNGREFFASRIAFVYYEEYKQRKRAELNSQAVVSETKSFTSVAEPQSSEQQEQIREGQPNVEAPYGYKKDGTPRKAPGRASSKAKKTN